MRRIGACVRMLRTPTARTQTGSEPTPPHTPRRDGRVMTTRSDAINHYATRAKLSRDRLRLLETGMLKICDVEPRSADNTAAAIEAERKVENIYERVIKRLGKSL